MNDAGQSEPSAMSEHIKPAEILEAPSYELEADMQRTITVRAGGSIRLFVIIKGRPTPEITWTKEGGIPSERSSIETTSSYSLLIVNNCKFSDAGKYELLLANSAGTKVVTIGVKVLDSPGPVQNLTVKDVTKNTVYLIWDQPKLDGGAAVTNYIVEKRLSTRKAWSTVSTEVQRESFKITGLDEGQEYFFRILAENKFGVGEPAETREAVRTSEVKLHFFFNSYFNYCKPISCFLILWRSTITILFLSRSLHHRRHFM